MLRYCTTKDYNRYFFKILQKRFCSKKFKKDCCRNSTTKDYKNIIQKVS